MEAYRITDKNSDGTVDTFRLFKSAKKVDPTFDSINYGKEKISHLLEALPSYFALQRKGKLMLVRKLEGVEKAEKAEEEIEDLRSEAPAPAELPEEPAPVEASPPARSNIDLLKVVTAAFDKVAKDDGLAFLPQLSKEVKRAEPDLDFKDHGKAGLREFLEEFSDVFTIHKKGRNVYISKRKGRRASQNISEMVR
jgi:hypothetical protein